MHCQLCYCSICVYTLQWSYSVQNPLHKFTTPHNELLHVTIKWVRICTLHVITPLTITINSPNAFLLLTVMTYQACVYLFHHHLYSFIIARTTSELPITLLEPVLFRTTVRVEHGLIFVQSFKNADKDLHLI